MGKKGFTLVELLAVIVILGIIAIITTPFIVNIIAKARQDAFVDSVYSLVNSASEYRAEAIMQHKTRTLNINFSNGSKPLNISGDIPNYGNLIMDDDGKIELKVWSDKAKICVIKSKDDSKVEIAAISKSECRI